jgi:hypothetical protein
MNTIQKNVRFRWFFLVVAFASLVGSGGAEAGHPQPAARAGLQAPHPAFYARAKANTNPATFSDASGDSGTAPDITNVVVSNDANSQITFRINVARLVVPSPVQIAVAIDSDQNEATGLSGTDYLLLGDVSNNTFGLGHWNGADFVDTASATVTASNDTAGITFSINRSELGNTTGLNFWARTLEGSDAVAGHVDDAPDQGTWNYQLVSGAPLKLAMAAFLAPKGVRAGKTLTAVMAATRSDTGNLVSKEGQVRCRARIGGKPLRLLASGFVTVGSQSGAGCSWRVPSNAHKKTIHGLIMISYQGASVSRQFAVRVK